MSNEIDEVIMVGDGILVEKPIIKEEHNGLYIPEHMQNTLFPTMKCKVVKVGPGSSAEMPVAPGDYVVLNKQQMFPEVLIDNKGYMVLAIHNILYAHKKV
jgi:co-chaperonin GroES (HSP10)